VQDNEGVEPSYTRPVRMPCVLLKTYNYDLLRKTVYQVGKEKKEDKKFHINFPH
jgi:hypothetical protein